MSNVKGKCPRCGVNSIELGTPTIKVGQTRSTRVSVRECTNPNCKLIFYETYEE